LNTETGGEEGSGGGGENGQEKKVTPKQAKKKVQGGGGWVHVREPELQKLNQGFKNAHWGGRLVEKEKI